MIIPAPEIAKISVMCVGGLKLALESVFKI